MSLHYLRLECPGLNQHTSTNAESMHYSQKYGLLNVSASMSTATSCNQQCNKTEIRVADMSKAFAQVASKNIVQDDSNTREFLTPWAEDMFCKQRDQMNDYWIVQLSNTKFILAKPRCIESDAVFNGTEKGK